MAIYFTSDLHLCHNREFLYKPRGFNSVGEMNEAIVENWNSLVNSEDDVFVLGDLMLNDNEESIKLIKSLKGKIHIIQGNHDTNSKLELYNKCYNVVEICGGKYFKYGHYHFFLSHYPTLCSNFDDNESLRKKVINLCGHSHTKDRWLDIDRGLIYHCELDAHNNTPISIDDIIEDIKIKLKK